jgi:hypothetical protein
MPTPSNRTAGFSLLACARSDAEAYARGVVVQRKTHVQYGRKSYLCEFEMKIVT